MFWTHTIIKCVRKREHTIKNKQQQTLFIQTYIYRGLQVRATPGQRQWSFANWLIATLSLIATSLNLSKHYHSPRRLDTWHSNSLYSNASSRLNDSHCGFVSHGICYNEAEVDLCFCWGVELFGGCIRVFFVFGCQAWEDMRSDCSYFRQGNKGTVFMQEESDWYIYIYKHSTHTNYRTFNRTWAKISPRVQGRNAKFHTRQLECGI